ncbi:ankyrin-1-like [Chenopodium quinoa]|uniref:PGG domain-containing protein n=1 Tax=Chenopodium quinoa TaxID=63459 RepID=A0A803KPI8_CHEQI|nr:ankyrin-1-like [Chenopodium quinoa]
MEVKKILEAAATGDVAILNEISHLTNAVNLLCSTVDEGANNIIHIAVKNDREIFIGKALQMVPQILLCKKNNKGRNVFHLAAERGHKQIVEALADSFHRAAKVPHTGQEEEVRVEIGSDQPPWIERDLKGVNPLHIAIKGDHQEVAMYLLSLDPLELICDACDEDGGSPLYLAIEKGWEEAALKMLEVKDIPYNQPNYRNPLSVAPYCSEKVFKKLLKEYPTLAKKNNKRQEIFLHEWVDEVENHKPDALKWLSQDDPTLPDWSNVLKRVICHKNNFGNNPLHIAARVGYVEAAELLVGAYSQGQDQGEGEDQPPWLQQNKYGATPLLMALEHRQEAVALCLLKVDPASQCKIASKSKESPLFLAVQNRCVKVAKEMIKSHKRWNVHDVALHTGPNKQNPLHVASNCSDIADVLTRSYPEWAESQDINGNTPLDKAAKAGNMELIKSLMECSGSENAPKAWIKACEGGHTKAILEFISIQYGRSGFLELYEQQTDTPLHHICLKCEKEYDEFFSIPEVETLKDKKDKDGATPLHRAIERKDEYLLKYYYVKDSMCKRLGLNPRIRTSYVQPKTNLGEMRGTMSVVAALLATITFAAGIQVPGGYKNSLEYAALGRKGAFLVFLISDTYAMCCSLLVLFCLIWAMGLDPDKSLLLIDLSVTILQHSLVGTLLAFMTGVFVVVSHETLWAAIVVIFMCSLVPFIAYKKILLKLLQKFIPTAQ